MITGWNVKETSVRGYSLLESLETRGPCPEVSIQLPTEVALEIKQRWDMVEQIRGINRSGAANVVPMPRKNA